MSISIKLLNPVAEITGAGFSALVKDINDSIRNSIPRITKKIQDSIAQSLLSQPEMVGLLDYSAGGLAAQLGLYPSQGNSAVSAIVQTVSGDVKHSFSGFNSQFKGSLTFYIAHEAVNKLLSLPVGHVVYGRGDLHWLEWMLERGDSILISNYTYNPRTGLGRSGGGNMVVGGSFRIPPEYSGTPENNFISRALYSEDFQNTIQKIIESNI